MSATTGTNTWVGYISLESDYDGLTTTIRVRRDWRSPLNFPVRAEDVPPDVRQALLDWLKETP